MYTRQPLLILRIENIYRSSDVVDGDFFVDARIRLPDGNMDLSACIAGGDGVGARRRRAEYRLRAYVHHVHGAEPPDNGMAYGHYVS